MAESEKEQDLPPNPYAYKPSAPSPKPLAPIISIPLAIGLIVLIILAFFVNLGLGICALLVSVPAYVRAAGSSLQKISNGTELTTIDRIMAFVGSVLVVGICVIAGGIGFFATCLGVLGLGLGSPIGGYVESSVGSNKLLISFISICGTGFFVAAGVIYWLFWPRRKRL